MRKLYDRLQSETYFYSSEAIAKKRHRRNESMRRNNEFCQFLSKMIYTTQVKFFF